MLTIVKFTLYAYKFWLKIITEDIEQMFLKQYTTMDVKFIFKVIFELS